MSERRPKFAKKPEKSAPKKPPPPGLAPRRAALDVLTLLAKGRTLDQALDDCRTFNALEGPDRSFAHALVAATLRRRGAIDHAIGVHVDRPFPQRSARVMDVLRLATAQSLVLKTPDHAAVSTAVALAEEFRETAGYAGLVNAIARKIAKAGPAAIEDLPERIDTQGWMWRGWERNFGAETARAIALAHRREAPIDLTAQHPAAAGRLAEEMNAVALPTGSIRIASGTKVTALPGFSDGAFWVQDAAAAVPARLLGDVRGKRVYDLCAAPGGKTLQLAAGGAEVVSVDIDGSRLKLIAENLGRTRLSAETIKADILDWTPDRLADAVLLDAPCTATGTIRRHPDILWSKTEKDLKALVDLQARMLDRALSFLRPEGVLVYCVCSLQSEEGERQAAAALARHPGLKRLPIRPDEVSLPGAVTREGDFRTHPAMLAREGGVDGFFAARLARA